MRLIHYTNEEFKLEPREYDQDDFRRQAKPHGLWISVEGELDWKSWCEGENYILENLAISYEVKLKKKAKILHLKTDADIFRFTKKYPYMKTARPSPEERVTPDTYELDWKKVKEEYQGIIIAPYQWNCRLALGSSWYYGWDCASGCIWDISCIKEFKLMEKK